MESESPQKYAQSDAVVRQLPITDFAHKAGVVGDHGMCAVFTARNMAAERCRAAALDRRHHLELAEAHMTGVGVTPRRSVVAENIRDLEPWTRHARRRSGGWLVLGFIFLGY
jgi:hypothetical protein